MLRDLLGLFRVTSSSEMAVRIELRHIVEDVIGVIRPQIVAKGVRISVGDIPDVWGQPRKLAHLATNLLANAVKHVPKDTGEIVISGRLVDGSVRVEFRDNGIGIPTAYHERIFELFRRGPSSEHGPDAEAADGSGVGLALVKRIVEDHRGRVWVDSKPGAGSRFFVELPAPAGVSTTPASSNGSGDLDDD